MPQRSVPATPPAVPSTTAASGGSVRPFREDDIPQVAELHRNVFATAPAMSPALLASYRTYCRQVFLDHPLRESGVVSQVYEEDGRVVGFIGAVPVPLQFHGEPLLAKVTTQFAIHPACRGIAGLRLLEAALKGPQHLTIADESNAPSRRVWEALGGRTAWRHSLRWIYPLRPFSLLSLLAGRGPFSTVARIGAPFLRLLDAGVGRARLNPYRPRAPRLTGEDIDCSTLLQLLAGGPDRSLRPAHTPESLAWALGRAAGFRNLSPVQKVVVRMPEGGIAGWYVYSAIPGGLAEVFQISARAPAAGDVFDHLIDHAGRGGATGLCGRSEPAFLECYSERRCPMLAGPWVMVHSANSELTRAFENGDVFFSRLEGERVLHFR